MRVTDITGSIRKGMWNYEEPYPRFDMRSLGEVPWAGHEVCCEVFYGLHSQTGTYLETPAHYYGYDKCYLVDDIPLEKLMDIPCVIINIDEGYFSGNTKRMPVTDRILIDSLGGVDIEKKCAILIGTGWGKHWMDRRFLDMSPYFTKDAMNWLISKDPFLLGTDFPRWENIEKPEGFFDAFYAADILMLAPCVNIEKIRNSRARLTVMPVKIPGTCAVPCRAAVVEEGD